MNLENAKEKALSAFRQPPLCLNCAQAVAHGLGRDDLLEQFQNCGVGRAPGGICGAIHAAATIAGTQNPARGNAILSAFQAQNGSLLCRELKQIHRVPCPQCVARAVEQFFKNPPNEGNEK